jgi:hypothetical protein
MQSQDHLHSERDTHEADLEISAESTDDGGHLQMELVRANAVSHRSPPPLPSRSMTGHTGMDGEVCSVDPSSDPRVSLEELVSAEEAALAPVEREAAASVPPHRRRAWSWLGWAAASALLVGGTAHYVLAYRPLEAQRERAETARAQRLQAHQEQLSSLRAELELTRAELEQANAAAAASKVSLAEAAAASDASAVEQPGPAQQPTKKHASRRRARRTRQSSDSASSAQGQGASSRRKAQASKPTDSSMPLRGVLNSSNDPLEGL